MALPAHASGEHLRRDFERFVAGRNEAAGITAMRRTAFERFETLGIPNTRHEDWRFTDVSGLARSRFPIASDAPLDAARLPADVSEVCHRLVFVNGRYHRGLSHVGALPKGVIVGSLADAVSIHSELVERYRERLPGLEDHAFTALNTAFHGDGAFLYLPRGAVLDIPLHLIYVATGGDTVSYPRNLIVLEASSQAVIVEDYHGEGHYWTCPVGEIEVGDGAALEHYKVQDENHEAWHLSGLRLRLNRDSHASLQMISSGAALARTDVAVWLDGEGADCTLNGLTLTGGTQLGDFHVRVEHAKPHGTSRQLFKGVLEGKSRAVFDGIICVRQGAQKTDARQSNRNLLLSKQAVADSNPRLEILADDVKCSHGSTIGYLDADAMFYLRSRGIGEARARAMLVFAFANDIIERIRIDSLRARLERLLIGRLNPDTSEVESS